MSKQYPGGIISKTPVTPSGPYSTDSASGIWTLDQQAYWQKLGQWPTAGNFPIDPQFNYVTMLLHGDGTNGAQNNTFLDSSTNNLSIIRQGNTTQGSFSPYGSNWSNYFGGSASYITVPSTLALSTSNYTVEFWFSGSRFELSWGTPGNYSPFTINSSGGIYFANSSNNAWIYNLDNFITTNGTWNHYAIVRNSGVVYLYRNGVQVGTSSLPSSSGAIGNVVIGYYDSGAIGYASNFRCVIGTAVYTSAFTPSTAPLTAITNTQLLTCQSNRFIDNSTNAYALTLTGTVSVQRFNPFGTSTAYSTSVIGGSGYFDGTGDYLNVGNNLVLRAGTSDFTFESWVYSNGVAGNEFIADFGSSNVNGWGLYDEGAGGNLQFRIANVDRIAVAPLVAGSWNHVAVVRSGTTATLYVNGISLGSYGSAGTNLDYTGDSYIGTQVGSNIMNGYLSDVRLVKGTAVYTSNFTPPTAPLTAITNTSLLLSMTNGAIFDNAMMNDLETVGNAQISTSVVKYGTGSMAFDGTGDALSTPNTIINSLGSGAFTIEMWVYRLGNGSGGISAYDALLGSYSAPGTSVYGIYITRSTGVINFFNSAGLVSSSNSLSNSSWTHIAVSRTSANNLQIFINGTSGYSATNTGTGTLTNPFYIASDGTGSGGNSNFYGYIDDLRITKGYARYTANFTPPTAAFFNYGPT